MTPIGTFTPEQARLLWQDYQSRQALPPQLTQGYPQRRTIDEVSPHRVFIRNDSGEEMPAYGCGQVTGVDVVGGRTVVTIEKPTDTDGQYLFCSQFKIPDGDVGWAFRYDTVIMLGDPPASPNTQYIPTVGAWTIEEGEGPFVVYGEHDSTGTLIGRYNALMVESMSITGASNCPCGTQYKRGSQSVTLNAVDYEHATTYTLTTSCFTGTWPFPEVTFDSGSDWVSSEEELPGLDCYTGSVEGQLTLTPCGYETVCSVDQLIAKITLATTLNDCEDEATDPITDDPEAVWICRNWNPLGPTGTFELVGPTKVGEWELPKFICVSPKAEVVTAEMAGVDCGFMIGMPVLVIVNGVTMSYGTENCVICGWEAAEVTNLCKNCDTHNWVSVTTASVAFSVFNGSTTATISRTGTFAEYESLLNGGVIRSPGTAIVDVACASLGTAEITIEAVV